MWQNPLREDKCWQLISQAQVTWLYSLCPKLLRAELCCELWCGPAVSSSSMFPSPLYHIRPMHSQPPWTDMPKIQKVKDYPRGISMLITNKRPGVIMRSDSITLNSLNSAKEISFLKKNSQSNTNKAIFLIYFQVIPTQFLHDYHLDV